MKRRGLNVLIAATLGLGLFAVGGVVPAHADYAAITNIGVASGGNGTATYNVCFATGNLPSYNYGGVTIAGAHGQVNVPLRYTGSLCGYDSYGTPIYLLQASFSGLQGQYKFQAAGAASSQGTPATVDPGSAFQTNGYGDSVGTLCHVDFDAGQSQGLQGCAPEGRPGTGDGGYGNIYGGGTPPPANTPTNTPTSTPTNVPTNTPQPGATNPPVSSSGTNTPTPTTSTGGVTGPQPGANATTASTTTGSASQTQATPTASPTQLSVVVVTSNGNNPPPSNGSNNDTSQGPVVSVGNPPANNGNTTPGKGNGSGSRHGSTSTQHTSTRHTSPGASHATVTTHTSSHNAQGSALHVTIGPALVQPGATKRIKVSFVPHARVRVTVSYPVALMAAPAMTPKATHKLASQTIVIGAASAPVAMVAPSSAAVTTQARTGVTDSHGRLLLIVSIPSTVKLHNGRAVALVHVTADADNHHATAKTHFDISDMTVNLTAGSITNCAQVNTVTVRYQPHVPVQIVLEFPHNQRVILAGRTNAHGYNADHVNVTYNKADNPLRIKAMVYDIRTGRARRMEQASALVTIPQSCRKDNSVIVGG